MEYRRIDKKLVSCSENEPEERIKHVEADYYLLTNIKNL